MNFYIGNSVDEVDIQSDNVEFSDELIEFIYKLRKQVPFDMSKLYEINPYDDVELSKKDLPQIIVVCNYIIRESLLRNYAKPDEGNNMLQDFTEFAQKAMSSGLGLISIGD